MATNNNNNILKPLPSVLPVSFPQGEKKRIDKYWKIWSEGSKLLIFYYSLTCHGPERGKPSSEIERLIINEVIKKVEVLKNFFVNEQG